MTTTNWDHLSDAELSEAAMFDEAAAWAHFDREQKKNRASDEAHVLATVEYYEEAWREMEAQLDEENRLAQREAEPNNWRWMTDDELTAAVMSILRSSYKVTEFQDRVKQELGYPYFISVHTSRTSLEYSRVFVMMQGHNGILSF